MLVYLEEGLELVDREKVGDEDTKTLFERCCVGVNTKVCVGGNGTECAARQQAVVQSTTYVAFSDVDVRKRNQAPKIERVMQYRSPVRHKCRLRMNASSLFSPQDDTIHACMTERVRCL